MNCRVLHFSHYNVLCVCFRLFLNQYLFFFNMYLLERKSVVVASVFNFPDILHTNDLRLPHYHYVQEL